jgi:pimeloyl-ACP methyl ester carboxylesterase
MRLLFGAADSAFPPPLTNHLLRSYRAYADHVEVAFVPAAAHFIADENPDAVVDHALKFFSGSGAPG